MSIHIPAARTGAITGVVDRRRVIIHPGPQEIQGQSGLYEAYMQALQDLVARYNGGELAIILIFVGRFVEINKNSAQV